MKRIALLAFALWAALALPAHADKATPTPWPSGSPTAQAPRPKQGSTDFQAFRHFSVTYNPADCASVTTCTASIPYCGMQYGDQIVMEVPANWDDDLIDLRGQVDFNGSLTIYFYNPTGSGIDQGVTTFTGFWWDRTNWKQRDTLLVPCLTATPSLTPTSTPANTATRTSTPTSTPTITP